MDYVLCIPRAALLANIGLSPATATSPPTVSTRHLSWEDWSRGGDVLASIGIHTTTHADIAVAACGSRVSIIFNMIRAIGPPAVSITAVYVFEMHRWAWAYAVQIVHLVNQHTRSRSHTHIAIAHTYRDHTHIS